MQSLLVIDGLNELPQVGLSIRKRLILFQIHLLVFERLEEALGFGMVLGMPVADMLTRACACSSRAMYSLLAYCTPRSEW